MQEPNLAGLQAIYQLLQQKYVQLDGIMAATKELDALADGNDPDAFGLYLDMRGNHMKRVDQLDKTLHQQLNGLGEELEGLVRACLAGRDNGEPEDAELAKLYLADRRNRDLMRRILELDELLRLKVGRPDML